MRGLVLDDIRRISYLDDLADPTIERASDAVVQVRRTGLCGSDLHPYEGREAARLGVVAGHEAVGEVVAIGRDVGRFAIGDRVLVPFTTSCGSCHPCRSGLSARCVHGELFGYGAPGPDAAAPLHGGQADLIRVPLADGTLVALPEAVDDATGVLLTDNVPTGWAAATRADVRPGRTLAVVGLGSVGLCSLLAARALGAATIVAVDPVGSRRDTALLLGADVVAHPDDAEAAVTEATEGIGTDAAIDATGAAAGQATAIATLRVGGTCSIIAVQTAERFAFSPVDAYDRNLTIRAGRAPVRSILDELVPQVVRGTFRVPTDTLLSHPAEPLADGPEVYRRFAAREPGLVKAAFVP